jgi:hypothetical protein
MPLVIAGLVTVALLGLVIAVSLGGSGNGGGGHHKGKKAARSHAGGTSSTSSTSTTTATTATTTTAAGSEVSVELRATDLVWICLVDDRGRADVNSETLTTGETRGPFASTSFEATFGNGSVELTVNGAPARIPPLAEPLSFRITSGGARELDSGSGPTCT